MQLRQLWIWGSTNASALLLIGLTFSFAGMLPRTNAGDRWQEKNEEENKLEKNDDQTLDVKDKQVKRLEVSSGFGGYRSTLIFYTFSDRRAILKVNIDNRSKMFPTTVTLYEFAEGVDEEGLNKWLNNQHSDALFGDAPDPEKTSPLAEGAAQIKSSKFIDQAEQRFGKFDNYKVSFRVLQMGTVGSFKLKNFEDEATVHLKVEK